MTNQDINKWIMYHEIHKLNRLGFSAARIARYLVMDPRTVGKYLRMNEDNHEEYLIRSERKKVLDPYENFVYDRLSKYPETSTAQIHDWLKEVYENLPQVTPRSVFNFVMYVRQKHNIPYIPATRDFFPVEELPYGHQAQVDFGEYNMRTFNSRRKKVYFFAMVLSRSRMKFIWFIDTCFTSREVVSAHEKAFEFFGGIPRVIVYDLDKTMVVDENLGDIILTARFREYTRARGSELHFCRKADPQSKGKVENVIQYTKKNFLYNRLYSDNETLNEQAIAWLARTANYLPHNYTKIPPKDEFLIEIEYLSPYYPLPINENPEMKRYTVRKNNVIAYSSNFYTLPEGTYTGVDSYAWIKAEQDKIFIYDKHDQLICSHVISTEKGKTIRNTHHKRDTTKTLNEMAARLKDCFSDKQLITDYLAGIRQRWPRYTRDHFQRLLKALSTTDIETADNTLAFCQASNILHAKEFEQVLNVLHDEKSQTKTSPGEIKLLNGNIASQMDYRPETSNIDDYDKYIN
jgi:transposase